MINVKDVNDNSPIFEKTSYRTQITEEDDRALPKRVLKVSWIVEASLCAAERLEIACWWPSASAAVVRWPVFNAQRSPADNENLIIHPIRRRVVVGHTRVAAVWCSLKHQASQRTTTFLIKSALGLSFHEQFSTYTKKNGYNIEKKAEMNEILYADELLILSLSYFFLCRWWQQIRFLFTNIFCVLPNFDSFISLANMWGMRAEKKKTLTERGYKSRRKAVIFHY